MAKITKKQKAYDLKVKNKYCSRLSSGLTFFAHEPGQINLKA